MEDSIVLQLQREAADSSVALPELLRKSVIVAQKLRIEDFQRWLACELDGYGKGDPLPPYRMVNGELRLQHPKRGWQPVVWEDGEAEKAASRGSLRQSVAELERLCAIDKSLMARVPAVERMYAKSVGFSLPIYLVVTKAVYVDTLGAVRDVVLNWTVDLAERGILGGAPR